VSLSLIVIARDEERDLPRCLGSVPFATEKIVVDSGSRDRTREVAAQAGAQVVEHAFESYGAQKAFALSLAKSEWVLSLDADESLSPALAQEIPAAIAASPCSGFLLRYRSEVAGRVLRFGGWGNERHLRLFRRDKASIEPVGVHEGFRVQGPLGRLRHPVLHRPYADLGEWMGKLDLYAGLAAKERVRRGQHFHPLSGLRAPWGFFRRYVLRLGFLDGYPGYLAAALGATYDMLKLAKQRELERPQI
jgi:glycosyltransferase involved in cell wall biosynthesis